MTRKEILETIRGGGSVLLNGRLITNEDEIPSAGQLASTPEERDAEIKRLEAQLAELKAVNKMGLPEDFPLRSVFEKLGFKSVEDVQSKSREDLIALEGIGEKTADAALAYGK